MIRTEVTSKKGNRMIRTFFIALTAAAVAAATVGCGTGIVSETPLPKSPIGGGLVALSGVVKGGEQPISGASIGLYVASTSGYAGAATNLVPAGTVTTSSTGIFSIPASDITCTSTPNQFLLLTASGGTSGMNVGPNSHILNMVALGDCETLGQYHHIGVNELTTIAAAYALQGFMSGPTNFGAPSTNLTGLRNAMNSASMVVNPYYGQVPGLLPAGATENQSELNTLADILVSCVNSYDGSGSSASTACTNLFSYTPNSSGTAPTDTGTAAVNMAQHPGTNVSQLIALSGSYQPFTPTIAMANDLTVAIRYTASSINAPVGIATDQTGNVWVANTGTGTNANVTEMTVPTVSGSNYVSPVATSYAGGTTGGGALAIDLNGNAWTASSSTNSIVEVSSTGTVSPYTIGGVGNITSIAADGSGYVWATGSGSAVNAVATSNGAALSTSGFTGGGTSSAQSLAITPH